MDSIFFCLHISDTFFIKLQKINSIKSPKVDLMIFLWFFGDLWFIFYDLFFCDLGLKNDKNDLVIIILIFIIINKIWGFFAKLKRLLKVNVIFTVKVSSTICNLFIYLHFYKSASNMYAKRSGSKLYVIAYYSIDINRNKIKTKSSHGFIFLSVWLN